MIFPFSAIVGQSQLTAALLLGAVDPRIGGVLVRGSKGAAKSTAVRGLAALLPDIETRAGCAYNCRPDEPADLCGACDGAPVQWRPTPLVELPVGASEDRLIGSIDLERALSDGVRSFQPGLLARAHRGLLYVDEVNLLDDHLVDVLLDAAAMGVNHVEREGVSARHPARFQLVGTMNPEEGELRPQLLDRFGLTVEVAAPVDAAERAEVVRRRLAFDEDPERFAERFAAEQKRLAERLAAARRLLPAVTLADGWLVRIAEVCAAFQVDGMRADIVTARTATALAAWDGRTEVERTDVRAACLLALPHRRRRGPFDDPGIDEDELDRLLGDDPEPPPDRGGDGPDDDSDGGGDDDPDDGGSDAMPPQESETDRTPGGPPSPPSGQGTVDGLGRDERGRDERRRDERERRRDDRSADSAASAADLDDAPAAPSGRVEAATVAAAPALTLAPQRKVGAEGRRSRGMSRRGAAARTRPLRAGETARAADLAVSATLIAAATRSSTARRVESAPASPQGRPGPARSAAEPLPLQPGVTCPETAAQHQPPVAPSCKGTGSARDLAVASAAGGTASARDLVVGRGVGGTGSARDLAVESGAGGTASAREPAVPYRTDRIGTDDVRAAATRSRDGAATETAPYRRIGRSDIRHYSRSGKQGHLIVLCVDASGSMGARRRMGAVKGAVRALLVDAYQRRDLVALVTFRGGDAETVLPPTAGVELADRRLALLPTGGRTPLAAGLLRAADLIGRHARRDPDRRPLLVAVTDGRANAGPSADPVADAHRAAEHLAAQHVPALVVDTESGFVRTGLAADLARRMAAPCVRLDEFASGALARTIRIAAGR